MHVHVTSSSGEAKFWVEPAIDLAVNRGLNENELKKARLLVERHEDEIRRKWREHFES